MLVLTRKVGEAILIGPDVAITVLDVRGDRVKLGIAAPAMVEILRREIAEEVRESNLAAARAPLDLSHLLPALRASLPAGTGERRQSIPPEDR